MNISRKKKVADISLAWRKMLADIPNGGSIKVADIRTDILYDGTPVYKGEDNLWHPIYTAVMQANAGASATSYKVLKGHNLKVGDTVYNGSSHHSTISAITTSNAAYDEITVAATLTAASAGDVLVVGDNLPKGLVIGHHVVEADMNLETGIGVIGTVMEVFMKTSLSTAQKAALSGIVFV